jgi:hypothetical protein
MNEWMNEWMTLFKSEKCTKWFFILHSVYRLKLLQYYYLSKVTIILVKLLFSTCLQSYLKLAPNGHFKTNQICFFPNT